MKTLIITAALILATVPGANATDSNGIMGTTDALNNYNNFYNSTQPSTPPAPAYIPPPAPVYTPPAADYSSPIDNGRRDAPGSAGGLYNGRGY